MKSKKKAKNKNKREKLKEIKKQPFTFNQLKIELNTLMKKIFSSKKNIIILICCILLVLLINFLINFNNSSFYIKIIDTYKENIIKKIENEYKNPMNNIIAITVNGNSKNKKLNSILEELKQTQYNIQFEIDYDNKLSNITNNVFYNNKNLLNFNFSINKDNMLLNLKDYGKSIRLKENNFWNFCDLDMQKKVINEFSEILKSNLKRSYFKKSSKTISSLGKKVATTRYEINLSKSNIYNLKLNIIEDIQNNKELKKSLKQMLNISENQLKNELDNLKKQINKNDSIVFAIYLNKNTKNIEKIFMKLNGDKIEFNKNEKDHFVIINRTKKEEIGYLTLDNNKLSELNIKLDKSTYGVIIKKDNLNGRISFSIKDNDGDYDLTFNYYYSKEPENAISYNYVGDIVDIDKLSKSEYNKIINDLYDNNNLYKLIKYLTSNDIKNQN